jgi:hypothetical protein
MRGARGVVHRREELRAAGNGVAAETTGDDTCAIVGKCCSIGGRGNSKSPRETFIGLGEGAGVTTAGRAMAINGHGAGGLDCYQDIAFTRRNEGKLMGGGSDWCFTTH